MTISTLVGLLLLIFTLKNPGRKNHGWAFLEVRKIIDSVTILASGSIRESSPVFSTLGLEDLSPKGENNISSRFGSSHRSYGPRDQNRYWFPGAPSSVQETLVVVA